MSDSTYNGWTNYETWAVGMYLDGNYTGEGTYRYTIEIVTAALENVEPNRYAAPEQWVCWLVVGVLQKMIEDEPDLGASYGLAGDMLGACWSRVNWYELAEAWIENVKEQVAS